MIFVLALQKDRPLGCYSNSSVRRQKISQTSKNDSFLLRSAL